MTEIKKRKKGQILNNNEKQLILNLMHYLRERNSGTSVSELIREISKATGCSERTIYKIRKEASKGLTAKTCRTKPRKRENKNSRNFKYDSYVKSSIRMKVHNYMYEKSAPTLNAILCLVNSDSDLPNFKRTTLHTLLKEIGFVYEQNGKKLLLTERCDSIKCRQEYLKDIRRFRSENRQIVYTGETVMNLMKKELKKDEGVVCHTVQENSVIDPVFISSTLNCGAVDTILVDGSEVCTGATLVYTIDACNFDNALNDTTHNLIEIGTPEVQEGKCYSGNLPDNKLLDDNSYTIGESSRVEPETDITGYNNISNSKVSNELRFTIMHAGSETGLLDGVEHVVLDKKRNDVENFERWFINKLLPKIPANSVVVVDNNLYHKKNEDIPDGSWKKHQIKSWLASRNANITEIHKKRDLLAVVNGLRSPYSTRQRIVELASQRGIILVSLPPYHYELNPLNMVWAQVKCYIRSNMRTFKVKIIKQLVKEAFYAITNVNWMDYVHHIRRMEDLLWTEDGGNQNAMDKT
ncbi:UNVERIFIED_CONTAM: hypothetical protein PYX00_003645 [Menopon gallinae]|uniref:Tc1-like transposase DDE domain-containing protein n=1 Tax=Menopon gallinae TaxID=328185 RepID=A0AAW2I3B2_9NEOP